MSRRHANERETDFYNGKLRVAPGMPPGAF
jgi:hypothetical protein